MGETTRKLTETEEKELHKQKINENVFMSNKKAPITKGSWRRRNNSKAPLPDHTATIDDPRSAGAPNK